MIDVVVFLVVRYRATIADHDPIESALLLLLLLLLHG
jgi:hypothetical protein